MQVVFVLVLLLGIVFGSDCIRGDGVVLPEGQRRCMVDSNGNGGLDGCEEMPLCMQASGKYVCPVDTSKGLCAGSDWSSPIEYQTDEGLFWGIYISTQSLSYSSYRAKLIEHGLACHSVKEMGALYEKLRPYMPLWVCDGALYSDGWFSASSCEYISFDNSEWYVEGECSNPEKTWIKREGERRRVGLLRGLGVDYTGRACNICFDRLSFAGGGESGSSTPSEEDLSECINPRFFPGQARSCRTGGASTGGASCCGDDGLFRFVCKREEKELIKMRSAGVCIEIGEYCSKRAKIGPFRTCVEKSRSYCCFNSRLAHVFHSCGRPQIGKGWGDAKNPDCSGFSIEEFSAIDWTNDACMRAIEAWANEMAGRIGDSVSNEIFQRVGNSIQNWLQDMRNQGGYGGR